MNRYKNKIEKIEKCYDCGKTLTKTNRSVSRFCGYPLCRKCAKFP